MTEQPVIVIIQSSLRKDSRTAVVTRHVKEELEKYELEVHHLDLRDFKLPFCDGRSLSAYFEEYPDVEHIYGLMDRADAYVLGYPNYVYTFSGVFKNFIDLFGGTTANKHFAMVVNAGGRQGYMASNDLISIMLYDFNATAIMPQIYTARGDFDQIDTGEGWALTAAKPLQKVEQTVEALLSKLGTVARKEESVNLN